jgi:hypothetical protein
MTKKCKAVPCELTDNGRTPIGNSSLNSSQWQGEYTKYRYVMDKILRKPEITTFHDFSVLYFVENLDKWCRQVSSPTWKTTQKLFALQGRVPGGAWQRVNHTDFFNDVAEQYFKDHSSDILVWRSRATFENYVYEHAPSYLSDGLHMKDSIYDEELQLLFNYLIY